MIKKKYTEIRINKRFENMEKKIIYIHIYIYIYYSIICLINSSESREIILIYFAIEEFRVVIFNT